MGNLKKGFLLAVISSILFYNCASEQTPEKKDEGIFGLYHGFMDLSLRLNSDSTYNFHSEIANDTGLFKLKKDTLYFISKFENTGKNGLRSFPANELLKLLDSSEKGYRINSPINGKMIFRQDTFYSLGTSVQYKYYKTL